jgi:transposase
MEIIAGVERRRHWRAEEKLRILAEPGKPGAKFVDVARRHAVSRGLLRQWRDAQRRGTLLAEEASLVPVRLVPVLPVPASAAGPTRAPHASTPTSGAPHDPPGVQGTGSGTHLAQGTPVLRKARPRRGEAGTETPRGADPSGIPERSPGQRPTCQVG